MSKILIVEDHDLTRESFSLGLSDFAALEVIGAVRNGQEALAFLEEHSIPDIILMDIAMPVLNGIGATQQIKTNHQASKIIMLTSHTEKEQVLSAFSAGADGYCTKEVEFEELYQIIRLVMRGGIWMDAAIAQYVVTSLRPSISRNPMAENEANKPYYFDLTHRELEILGLVAQGHNNKAIAEQLSLSIHTVKRHVSNIIQKLAVDDRTQAVVLAFEQQLI